MAQSFREIAKWGRIGACIYSIENIKSLKKYIGSSRYIYRRAWRHRNELRKNKHHNPHLQNAWNKYGEDEFRFTVIRVIAHEITEEELEQYEQYYIDYYRSKDKRYGYNITDPKRIVHSAETRAKISRTLKAAYKNGFVHPMQGKKHKADSIEKMRRSQTGIMHTSDSRKKISNANKGRIVSEETRSKISASEVGKIVPDEVRERLKLAGVKRINRGDLIRDNKGRFIKNKEGK